MKSLIVTPKDKKELRFLKELLERLDARFEVVSLKNFEDDRLVRLMKSVDRKKTVSKHSIIKKIRK